MSSRLLMQRRKLKENSEYLKQRAAQEQRSGSVAPFGVSNLNVSRSNGATDSASTAQGVPPFDSTASADKPKSKQQTKPPARESDRTKLKPDLPPVVPAGAASRAVTAKSSPLNIQASKEAVSNDHTSSPQELSRSTPGRDYSIHRSKWHDHSSSDLKRKPRTTSAFTSTTTPAVSSSLEDRDQDNNYGKPPSGRQTSTASSTTASKKNHHQAKPSRKPNRQTPSSLTSALPSHTVASLINGGRTGLVLSQEESSVGLLSQETTEPARQLRFGDGSTAKKPPAAAATPKNKYQKRRDDSDSSDSDSSEGPSAFKRLFRQRAGLALLSDEKAPPKQQSGQKSRAASAASKNHNMDDDSSATEEEEAEDDEEEETQPTKNTHSRSTKHVQDELHERASDSSSSEQAPSSKKKRRASVMKRQQEQLDSVSSHSDDSSLPPFVKKKFRELDPQAKDGKFKSDLDDNSKQDEDDHEDPIQVVKSSPESDFSFTKGIPARRRQKSVAEKPRYKYRTYESTSEESSPSSSEEECDDSSRARRNNDKSLMDDSSDEEPVKRVKKKKKNKASTAHNPLVLERLEQERQTRMFAEAITKRSTPSNADLNDSLWSDDEEVVTKQNRGDKEDEVGEDQLSNTKKRKRGKSKSASSTKKRSGKKGGRKSSDKTDGTPARQKYFELYSDDKERENLLKIDHNVLKDMNQPNFEAPRFGPFSLDPLLLTGEQGAHHQVPSSMSRYLLPYQQKGISFMHSALTSNRGCILGDDMGLGKTVQVLSLLSALFKKTGTGVDLLELARRRKIVEAQFLEMKKREEEALLNGLDADLEIDYDKAGLNVSSWSPTMIMVPSSVVDNWKNEFKTWTHFEVAVYEGSNKDAAIESVKAGLAEVMIVTHSTFKNNPEKSNDLERFLQIQWKLTIIDEFHVFKNAKTIGSQNLRTLKGKTKCLVLGMTGTPMQNNHNELWNIVDLAQTDYLGSWEEFERTYSKPIKYGRVKDANVSAIERSEAKAKVLAGKLAKILLSRTKEIVLADELPQKNEKFVLCELSPLQKAIYEHILTLPDFEMLRTGFQPCNCSINAVFFQRYNRLKTTAERLDYYRRNKGTIVKRRACCFKYPYRKGGEPGEIDPRAAIWRTMKDHEYDRETGQGTGCDHCGGCCLFPALHKLYKLSSHVALLQPKKTTSEVGSKEHLDFLKELEFAKVAFPESKIMHLAGGTLEREDGLMDDHFALSGKMKVMDSLLKKFSKEGSRVLIFSYSTQTLDLIENYIKGKHQYLRMDGSTNSKDRQKIADRYRDDPTIFAFLLSTKAMGLGLNLCEANKVIIFDVEWNPSWDQQAQDRAYRIGQKQDVDVYRLVAQGTIDEVKFLRQLYKVQLKQETLKSEGEEAAQVTRIFRGIQGDDSRRGELFGSENLLKYKDGSFLNDIWKKSGAKPSSSNRKGDSRIMNADEVSNAMKNVGSGQDDILDSVASEEGNDVSLRHIDAAALERAEANKQGFDGDGWATREASTKDANDDLDFGENEINHDDLFKGTGGRASLTGENGMDEEMGQLSQDMFNMGKHGEFDCFGEDSDQERDNDKDEPASKTQCTESSDKNRGDVETDKGGHETNVDEVVVESFRDSNNDSEEETNAANVTAKPAAAARKPPPSPRKTAQKTKSSSPLSDSRGTAGTSFQLDDLAMPSYASKKKRKRKKKKPEG